MKRVLFVDHASRILGGAEINLIELLSGASESNWRHHCAITSGSPLANALNEAGVQTHSYEAADSFNKLRVVGRALPLRQAWEARKSMSGAVDSLAQIVRSVNPDVIISCTNKDHYAVSLLNERRAKADRIPSIWWVNDVISSAFFPLPVRVAFAWRAIRFAHRLVAVSGYARQALIRLRIPTRRCVTIHNGIPLGNYRPRNGSLRWRPEGVPQSEPVIAIIGRFTPWKGQHFFLKLATGWLKQNKPGSFALIGQAFNEDAPFEHQLRELANKPPLHGHVHFVPFQKDVRDILSGVDVLIHASQRPEPFGRVIIEGMAAGVPVIAARAGGVPEIITHGEDGLLARPGCEEDYSKQLQSLLENSPLRRRICEGAAATVSARFSIERVREQFSQLIEEAGSCT